MDLERVNLPAGEVIQHNLPVQLTSFIGRQREMAELQHLVKNNRLVTITGAGGGGKTRLALQVGRACLSDFPDGMFLVELAPLTNEALVTQAVISALTLPNLGETSSLELLTGFLKTKQFLLILDNCEHLINISAQLTYHLLLNCSNLHILATSREALNIESEITWRIPSLTLPPPLAKDLIDLTTFSRSEAVQLFVERAKNAQPAFQLEQQNLAAIAKICQRLDGIPLALELAAANLKAIRLEDIAARLDHSLGLLSGGSRLASKRQQTLEATIAWSYNLLALNEQVLFRRLSIFPGGFTIEDVEMVCSYPPLQGPTVLALLRELSYKSMVLLETGRYRMLEMLRQYGHSRLVEADELAELQARFAGRYLQLARQLEIHGNGNGPEQKLWTDRLTGEYDNLRAVMDWCFAGPRQEQREIGVEICARLAKFWRGKIFGEEGRVWLQKAAKLTEVEESRAKLLTELGYIAIFSGEPASAIEIHQASVKLWRTLGDKSGLAEALTAYGNTLVLQREAEEAQAVLKESLALHIQLGNKHGQARTLCNLGMNYHGMDRFKRNLAGQPAGDLFRLDMDYRVSDNQDKARAVLEEALRIGRETTDEDIIGFVLQILGEVARTQGDYAQARLCYEETLQYRRESRNFIRLTSALLNLGFVANHFQEYAQARAYLNEGLKISKNHHLFRSTPAYFFAIAQIARACGQPERAVRLLAAGQSVLHNQKATPDLADMLEYYQTLEPLRRELESSALAKIWLTGQQMSLDQAIDYALEDFELTLPSQPPHSEPTSNPLPAGLSPREGEVLRLLAGGLTNAEIAEKLVVSPRTVDAHLTAIYSKLGVKSRSAATRFALENRLV